jgi:hypothetical protein
VVACGFGRRLPTGPVIDDFDGVSQVVAWWDSDVENAGGRRLNPIGSLMVLVKNARGTLAKGVLAVSIPRNRPCLDGSAYTGIQFELAGNVTQLTFAIETPATLPESEGGTCSKENAPQECSAFKARNDSRRRAGLAEIERSVHSPRPPDPPPGGKTCEVAVETCR